MSILKAIYFGTANKSFQVFLRIFFKVFLRIFVLSSFSFSSQGTPSGV